MARDFRKIIEQLEARYGRPRPPAITDPFHLILHENVGYLVDDERRNAAFAALRERIGLEPASILAASGEDLAAVARLGGIFPEQRIEKLRRSDRLITEKFQGDLGKVLRLPLAEAKKKLRLFPGIGEPGAERILLFTRTHPILALESNGLRTALRLGFGKEDKNYAAMYRSAQQALADRLPKDCDGLMRVYQLLRRHGQELCKRTNPQCESCPVSDDCAYYRASAAARSTSTRAKTTSPSTKKTIRDKIAKR